VLRVEPWRGDEKLILLFLDQFNIISLFSIFYFNNLLSLNCFSLNPLIQFCEP